MRGTAWAVEVLVTGAAAYNLIVVALPHRQGETKSAQN